MTRIRSVLDSGAGGLLRRGIPRRRPDPQAWVSRNFPEEMHQRIHRDDTLGVGESCHAIPHAILQQGAKCEVLKAIFSTTPTASIGRKAQRKAARRAQPETSSSQLQMGAYQSAWMATRW